MLPLQQKTSILASIDAMEITRTRSYTMSDEEKHHDSLGRTFDLKLPYVTAINKTGQKAFLMTVNKNQRCGNTAGVGSGRVLIIIEQ